MSTFSYSINKFGKIKITSILSLIFLIALLSASSFSVITSAQGELTENLDQINVSEAWEVTQGNNEVVVAVIDSGINTTSNLPDNIRWENELEITGEEGVDDDGNGYIDDYHGWDFINFDNDPSTDGSGFSIDPHGTAISSVIVSPHNAAPFGIAPNVKIMDVRALDVIGSGSPVTIFSAVSYAVENGADVISMSLGTTLDYPGNDFEEFQEAAEEGIPVVIAAGNDPNTISDFARDDSVLTISSINGQNELSSFSSFGEEVDFTAPGELVACLSLEGDLIAASGTSLSAPHVTGVLALMLSVRDDLPREYLDDVMAYAAVDLGSEGKDNRYGHGLVDAGKSVKSWRDFESIDFNGDGKTAGSELAAGQNPFEDVPETSDEAPINIISIMAGTFMIFVITRFSKKKYK